MGHIFLANGVSELGLPRVVGGGGGEGQVSMKLSIIAANEVLRQILCQRGALLKACNYMQC